MLTLTLLLSLANFTGDLPVPPPPAPLMVAVMPSRLKLPRLTLTGYQCRPGPLGWPPKNWKRRVR